MKLLAIDGNSIINRAYYGIRPLSTKEGIFTNGIYGFLTILLKMCAETSPDAVAVTFDMRAPTFRHLRYDKYKAGRHGMPDELAMQMPLLKELLTYLGYRIVELEGFEADDLLGTLALAFTNSGDTCVIATGDRDSFQLVSDSVSVRLASTKGGRPQADMYDTTAIVEKYGVTPPQLIDVKALMGDASDNIPGVAGVGEKTALSLITQFKSMKYIYDNIDTLPIKDNLRAKLVTSKELALLSYELAEINCHAPIETTPALFVPEPLDNASAYNLMAKLELFSLMEKLGVSAPTATATASTQDTPALEISFNTLPLELLEQGQTLDVLFEWAGAEICAICIVGKDCLHLLDKDLDSWAAKILTSPANLRTTGAKILHHYALSHGFEIANITFDMEIAGYILSANSSEYTILRLASEYEIPSATLDNLLGVHSELLEQAALLTRLADKLTQQLAENDQVELFGEIELPLARVLADMEDAGFEIDTVGLETFGIRLDGMIASAQQNIYTLAGEEFNINSPKQMGVILFEKLSLPAGKKTKTGYSTNADVLEGLVGKHEIIEHILQYRGLAKLKSTYVEGLLRVVATDGRIHTSFMQTLTRTGRISSTEPNMQNIPVRTELGSELRRFFRSKNGCMLLSADYSQIELRVLAHIANDQNMMDAFTAGEDIHTNTAARVFDLPPLFVTPMMRSRAKAVNFGIVYGISAFSLSRDINVSVAEADKYIKEYLRTYSGVKNYMQKTIDIGTEKGYVKTLFQRRRYIPELASSNRALREFGKRVAMNTPIQGTAADIIKIAMVRVFARLKKEKLTSRLILQVHDELIIESPLEEIQTATAILQQEMENAVSLSVKMIAEVTHAPTWGTLEKENT